MPEGWNVVARYYDVRERTQIGNLTDEVVAHTEFRRRRPELCYT